MGGWWSGENSSEAFGGSVGDKNLHSKVFRPSERNGSVSFAKKWPKSRVSRVAALKL